VHDENTVLCPDSMVDYVVTSMRELAQIPLFVSGLGSIIIPVDIIVGKDWKNGVNV